MSTRRDDRPELDPDEARFVERLRAATIREPLSAAERSGFDAALRERLEHSRTRVGLWPALGAGVVAAAAVLLLLRGALAPGPEDRIATGPATRESWTQQILYADPLADEEEDTAETEGLPPDYAAIAGVFLDR